MNLKNINNYIIGTLSMNVDSKINNIAIDSRSLQINENTLFFALIGNNNNAHKYIEKLIDKGVRNFVISDKSKISDKANFLLVDDTLKALQEFSKNHRLQFTFPIIGITGSNGKTIVKEWLSFLLAPDFNVAKSPKSYNSQIGVPLSVLGINENHNFGIFEAGISLPEEMEKLQNIIQPTIGILTNIGDAHNEGFKNIDHKIDEKLKLFTSVNTLIYKYNTKVSELLYTFKAKQLCWSYDNHDKVIQIHKSINKTQTTISFTYEQKNFEIIIPFIDEASIENAINSLLVLVHLNYSKEVIQERISLLYPIEMRLNVKNGINNTTIIDDSYISDFQSLKIALDFLEQQKQHSNKSIIFSDIHQSGESKEDFYKKVSQLLSQNQINSVIGIGPEIMKNKSLFPDAKLYISTSDFLTNFDISSLKNQTILIKGARSFQFEEIVSRLEEKTHQTVLEINLNSITHNLNYYKSKIKPSTKMMVMIKAFGYGSGSFEIAKLLEYHKIDYLGVAFTDEGIQLRNSKITIPIIVMNPEPNSFEALIKYKLEPEIYSLNELKKFKLILDKTNLKNYPIHIKIDSGMHRLGFQESDINSLTTYINEYKDFFDVKSIFSHLSGSDNEEFRDFTIQQFNLFEKLANQIKNDLNIKPICHISNTSAISNYPEFQLDMVRLGIGLYGISNDIQEMKYLENVGTLKSVILQIKEIEIGESVGYSRGFIAESKTKIATIPIGYADGIPRGLSKGNGYVIINKQKAPIIGVICMDMLMVDITHINCQEGDSVIIFGENPNVIEIAEKLQTIPYEILAGISQRVKRVFYRE